VPSFVGKSFGVGKTVNICEDSDVGEGEIHLLKHPGLNRKIKTLCHDGIAI
jgi:hypothetical protein